MRRKNSKDIVKENYFLIIISVLFISFGILLYLLPIISPPVSYDSLQTKDVIVHSFYSRHSSPGGSHYYIETTDSEEYTISGDFELKQLNEELKKNKVVTIKWFKNNIFGNYLAEEIYADGNRIVSYNDVIPVNWTLPLIGGSCFVSFGIGCILLLKHFIHKNTLKQKQRDEKIIRKYGDLKK